MVKQRPADEPEFAAEERPSKSARKRLSHDLQALGESLIELPEADYVALPLPEKLRDAVDLARRITRHGGLYRQKQYIGKLMRQIDAEPLRAALAQRDDERRRAAASFKRIERWRDRLIEGGEQALDEFVAYWPAADRRELDAQIAAARREHAGLPGTAGAARRLFATLRAVLADDEDQDG
jgi:ribosome-associated protein